ncbi:MAG: PilZ domain-containing protein [Desulfobacteraceae bacterium]|nr:PilZ domain-containing protein [Desulfobacteraceae bacterium]
MGKQDSTKDDIERRNHERVEFSTSLNVIIETEDEKIEVEGDSKDLSLKGIFLTTDKKAPVGSLCSVKIFLTGSKDNIELHIQGVIARTENKGLGITFDSMDVDSFTYLKNIVKYNSDNN